MTDTPNHGYNVPEAGEEDWHRPLNENFEAYDVDIELRDESANLENYEPQAGAKFLATDTGVVYVGDGSDWLATLQAGRYTPPTDPSNAGSVAFGGSDNDTGDADGASVGGGDGNEASGDGATVGGGESNRANDSDATIGGGSLNRASSERATVGGGYRNRAGGASATVPGGRQNVAAGDYSFAAGRKAEAIGTGTFVWNNSGSRFRSGGDNQFIVNAVGGVGIGTAPDAPLHVGPTDDPAMEGDFKIGTDDHRFFVHVETEGEDSGTVHLVARGTDAVDQNNMLLGAGEEQLRITDGFDDGFRDVPTLAPTENEGVDLGSGDGLRFNGLWAETVFADDLIENSDARLKENVARLEAGLEAVTSLRPVTYEWTDENRTDGRQLGLIAQEVQEVVPEVVRRSDEGDEDSTLSLSYSKLVPVLIDAIQCQQADIEEREERIDDLEERLVALESQVNGGS
ncbi:tail fiber domain-containing protein [Haloarchaeobius salinus]|uniref:tail fiber domain-containing protein n=1 Tax=Haloarchaeobius salinus TaxID=1198298 RepID=UPI00210E3A21|nr:tail fiber domain-containing protein [Haloarchaeobius salinus]